MLESHPNYSDHNRLAFRAVSKDRIKQGFTLFEVSISMVIVAFGVVSVLMLLPIGMKAQEMARFQIYVSAKAEEMIEQFSATPHSNPYADSEGLAMWDLPVAYKTQSWDFESRLSASRFGNMPLPLDIARRLDSANDQIREILDSGGHIYYSQPRATSGIEDSMPSGRAPNESQRVIIGIKGYAQQNWMSQFPLKNFPYFAAWPSPPMHVMKKNEAGRYLPVPNNTVAASKYWNFYDWPVDPRNYSLFPWETASKAPKQTDPTLPDPLNNYPDPDIQKVFDYPADSTDPNRLVVVPDNNGKTVDSTGVPMLTGNHYGFMPYAYGRKWNAESGSFGVSPGAYPTPRKTYNKNGMPSYDAATAQFTLLGLDKGGYPSRPSVLRYVAATVWYAKRKGITLSNSDGTANPYAPSAFAVADRWKEVQAFRFLAHATTCLTGWYSYIKTGTDPEDLGNTGITIPLVSWDGVASDPLRVTHKMIQYYHERSHFLINNFTASYPYDWAVPRSLNRPTMMDFPLMQCDLFTPPLPVGMPVDPIYDNVSTPSHSNSWDYIFGRSTTDKPQQWRALSAQPIRNVGVSISHPTNKIDATMSAPGSPYLGTSHFGNIDHFNLTAPFEAAERCRQLIFWSVDWQSYEDFETAPSTPIDASKYPLRAPESDGNTATIPWLKRLTKSSEGIMNFNRMIGEFWSYRNPERELNYFPIAGDAQPPQPPNGFLSLATGTDMTSRTIQRSSEVAGNSMNKDLEGATLSLQVFSGLYGADRNYNHKLDRGPVPRSVRLRAVEIARFNFYDPRVQVTTR